MLIRRAIVAGCAVALLVCACSSSSNNAAPPTTTKAKTPTTKPKPKPTTTTGTSTDPTGTGTTIATTTTVPPAKVADLILNDAGPGFLVQPDAIADTGPTKIGKAADDDISPDALEAPEGHEVRRRLPAPVAQQRRRRQQQQRLHLPVRVRDPGRRRALGPALESDHREHPAPSGGADDVLAVGDPRRPGPEQFEQVVRFHRHRALLQGQLRGAGHRQQREPQRRDLLRPVGGCHRPRRRAVPAPALSPELRVRVRYLRVNRAGERYNAWRSRTLLRIGFGASRCRRSC